MSCLGGFGRKSHRALIADIYPPGVSTATDPNNTNTNTNDVKGNGKGGVKPKANQLSLLVFYANSKPNKIAKIGDTLKARIDLDLRKNYYL
jgi:hypothetical protein